MTTIIFHFLDREAIIHEQLLEHRREALFSALQVIDHVYSNEFLDRGRVRNPHEWDIQLARDAENKMRIYCQDPETLDSFRSAIGLYNPTVQKAHGIPNLAWIAHLAGTK